MTKIVPRTAIDGTPGRDAVLEAVWDPSDSSKANSAALVEYWQTYNTSPLKRTKGKPMALWARSFKSGSGWIFKTGQR
jgi:hypothetical protein